MGLPRLSGGGFPAAGGPRSAAKLQGLLAQARRVSFRLHGSASEAESLCSAWPIQRLCARWCSALWHHSKVRVWLLVDFSSLDPAATREMAVELEQRRYALGRCPVSGGTPSGNLAIMAGGRIEDIERIRPFLAPM